MVRVQMPVLFVCIVSTYVIRYLSRKFKCSMFFSTFCLYVHKKYG